MGLLKHENTQSRGEGVGPSKVSRKKELIWEKEPRKGGGGASPDPGLSEVTPKFTRDVPLKPLLSHRKLRRLFLLVPVPVSMWKGKCEGSFRKVLSRYELLDNSGILFPPW